jgi:HEAT repeat protein
MGYTLGFLMTRCFRLAFVALSFALAVPCAAAAPEVPRANGAPPTPLAVEQALEELKADDWILKWAAMSQLARWKVKEAAQPIKAVVAGRDHPWVRGRALVALAELLGEGALEDAQAGAKQDAPELRAAAVEALGIIAAAKGEAAIAERLRDPVAQVRHQAIVALARVRKDRAWETVSPLLADADPATVLHATRALVYINTPEAQRAAIALLSHADAGVRAEAASTLGQARVRDAIAVLLQRMASDSDAKVRVACEKALASFDGNELLLPMLAALRGEQREQHAAALKVLAVRPTLEACEGVAALIREPTDRYRDALSDAFHVLTRLDPDRYQGIFVAYLESPVPYVRCRALESLGRCPKAEHFKLVRPLLVDRDQSVRVAAFRVLRENTEGAPPEGMVQYLAEVFQRTDKWSRRTALDLLSERIAPAELPKAIDVLVPLLGSNDKDERAYVAKALAGAGDDATRRRIARAQGYVTNWMLIGTFPRENRNRGLGASFFPEHEIDLKKTYESFESDPSASFKVVEATCGGEKKKALLMQPPTAARAPSKLVASFRLELPEAKDLKLTMSLGLQDDSPGTDGVQFEVYANDTKVLEKKLLKPEGWQAAEASLAEYAGKTVTLDLVVDPLGNPKDDRAAVGDPKVVSGDQTLAPLVELAESAPVRVVGPASKGQLAWQAWKTNRIDGEVPLYDIFPPPTADKVAYGVADITVADGRKAQLWLKCDDGCVVWLNGTRVVERANTGEQKADVTLRAGSNRFLIKSSNYRDWWRYELRLTDPEGRAIEFRQNE